MVNHPNRRNTRDRVKSVFVAPHILNLCFVKAARADELTRDEVAGLMRWCDCQREDLWDGMSLQEILNVYRRSAEFETWESWEQEEPGAARDAWNEVVKLENQLVRAYTLAGQETADRAVQGG
jgi:hypothetical protein